MTETRRPSALKYGIRRASSVVLPAPLHPARPITFILFSKPATEPGDARPKAALYRPAGNVMLSSWARTKIVTPPAAWRAAPAPPGVLPAGGLARRMGGGEKPMRPIG